MKKSKVLFTNFAGLKLKNPVFIASGIAGFGEDYSELFDLNILGGFITKTITLKPCTGNIPPRIIETPSGMLNSIGIENPGLEVFCQEKLPFLRKKLKIPVVVSITGKTVKEYTKLTERLNKEKGVSAIELNFSCPNIKTKMMVSQDPKLTYQVISSVRKKNKKPLIAKLSPNVTDITVIARAVEDSGADGISLINSLKAMAIDIKTKKPVLGNIFGGLSGPAIKPVALRMVYEVCQKVNIPVMGMGGINSVTDAIEFFIAGAKTVAIGSGLFSDPGLPKKIINGLKKL